MGQTLSSTRFVGEDHRVAAQSFQPCHLFGDPDIYGLGIRLGFYIQYLAAIVAMLTGYTDGLRGLRMGLAILVISLFITLLVNSTGNSLVVLDWYIVMALMGKYVFFSDIFVRAAAGRVFLRRRRGKKDRDRDVVGELLGEHLGEEERERQRALFEAGLAVHRANYALEDADKRDCADELMALRHALTQFSRAIITTTNTTTSPSSDPDLQARYTPDRITKMTTTPHTFKRQTFTTDFLTTAHSHNLPRPQALRAEKSLRAHAKRQHRSAHQRQTLADIREGLQANRPLDMLTIGVICVSWAAYQFVRPWLYWRAVDRGRKDGCDVRFLWLFVPASVYNEGFRDWLRTWAVVMFLLGAGYFVYGVFILGRNMFRAREWFEKNGTDGDGESQRGLLGRGREDGSSLPDDDEDEEQGIVRSKTKYRRRRAGRGRRQFFRMVGAFQFVLLALTIGITEGTLALNDIDMRRGDFKTSSQLMAFFVALVTSVPVFWESLVIAPLRWYLRRKKGDDWEREEHEKRGEEPTMSRANV